MLHRKKSQNSDKKRDFTSQLSPKEQQKFLEFLKFQSITKKELSLLSEQEQDKYLEFKGFKSLFRKLKELYKLSTSDLLRLLENDVLIPISIFNSKLGSLETISKYLKENLNLSNKTIAFLTKRSSKSIWQAYNSSKKKHSRKLKVTPSKFFIPASILHKKELSILENIVVYLRDEFSLNYHEIALLLKRDDRTIWTVYQKARKKNVKN